MVDNNGLLSITATKKQRKKHKKGREKGVCQSVMSA